MLCGVSNVTVAVVEMPKRGRINEEPTPMALPSCEDPSGHEDDRIFPSDDDGFGSTPKNTRVSISIPRFTCSTHMRIVIAAISVNPQFSQAVTGVVPNSDLQFAN